MVTNPLGLIQETQEKQDQKSAARRQRLTQGQGRLNQPTAHGPSCMTPVLEVQSFVISSPHLQLNPSHYRVEIQIRNDSES